MRYVLILALLSGLAAFIASQQALETASPSWTAHLTFVQSSVAGPVQRLRGEEAAHPGRIRACRST